MMITKSTVDRAVNLAVRRLIGAMPAIPDIMRSRRRTPIAAYVLGGIGIAIAGGVAALLFLSPRTRSRAINAARDAYERVNERIVHRHDGQADIANGLAPSMEEPSAGL